MTQVVDAQESTSGVQVGLTLPQWRLIGWGLTAVCLVVGVFLPWMVSGYQLSEVSGALYLSLGVLSMNLLTGLNGQISLGQSAFVGIGAYSVAILVTDHGWSYPAAIVAAAVLAAAAGVIVALPALRLRGLYVALTTFGIGLVFPSLIQKFSGTTGGTSGIPLFPLYSPPSGLGLTVGEWAYLVTLFVLAICLLFVQMLKTSTVGRMIQAIRDADVVAEGFGVPLAKVKVATFAASAAIAGLAGALFAIQNQFVSPDDLTLTTSVNFFVGMAIGGSVSVPGAIVGGFFLQYAPDLVQEIGITPIYTPAIYGALLIVIILFARTGVAGLVRKVIEPLVRR